MKVGDRVIIRAKSEHRLGFLNALQGTVVKPGRWQYEDETSVQVDGYASFYYVPTELLAPLGPQKVCGPLCGDTACFECPPDVGRTNSEMAWLAGLFEGEGNFNVAVAQRGRKASLRVCVRSCDEDVIRRAHAVSGVGCVFGPYSNGRSTTTGELHKDFWIWQVAARAEAVEIARCLYPLLGARRREQATIALAKIGESLGHPAD